MRILRNFVLFDVFYSCYGGLFLVFFIRLLLLYFSLNVECLLMLCGRDLIFLMFRFDYMEGGSFFFFVKKYKCVINIMIFIYC